MIEWSLRFLSTALYDDTGKWYVLMMIYQWLNLRLWLLYMQAIEAVKVIRDFVITLEDSGEPERFLSYLLAMEDACKPWKLPELCQLFKDIAAWLKCYICESFDYPRYNDIFGFFFGHIVIIGSFDMMIPRLGPITSRCSGKWARNRVYSSI